MRQGLRIALMGAGATGKTTTAKCISKEFSIPLLKSISRELYEKNNLSEFSQEGKTAVIDLPDNEKWKLQEDIFKLKVERDDDIFTYVADRTLLDHWAYCLLYCAHFLNNNTFSKYELMVKKHMLATYSRIYYFPWGYWDAENKDKTRAENKAWQNTIDTIILGYILKWNLPIIEVPQTNGIDFRNNFVVNDLKTVLGLNKE